MRECSTGAIDRATSSEASSKSRCENNQRWEGAGSLAVLTQMGRRRDRCVNAKRCGSVNGPRSRRKTPREKERGTSRPKRVRSRLKRRIGRSGRRGASGRSVGCGSSCTAASVVQAAGARTGCVGGGCSECAGSGWCDETTSLKCRQTTSRRMRLYIERWITCIMADKA